MGRIGHRHRRHQLAGVRVLRIFKHCPTRANLNDLPEIHHRHPVADALHYRHIVRNKQKCNAHLPLQIEQQIDDLRPNGDIQRRDRLVGNHHLRIQRQRAGNADPLPLTAGKFMGIAPGVLRLEAHALQQPRHPPLGSVALQQVMYPQRLHNRIAHRLAGIEGGIRVLKNKLNIPPQGLQLPGRQGVDALTVKGDGALLGLHQPQQRPAGGRFAAAGLAHQRQRFAGP
ncbi:hypothetical protein D3C76_1144050 [compost metagenome]